MRFTALLSRTFLAIAICGALGYGSVTTASAQVRQQMANNIATDAANKFVAKIQGQSCADFAQTMAQMKSGGGSSSSGMSSKLKSNPAARTTFVNIVAGPLLNKMIDCDMLNGM